MFRAILISILAALLFIYTFLPAVWQAITAVDDFLDVHESGVALVASKNPVRETGPPVCMAKLIMQRHKIHQSNRRKRRNTSPRPASRLYGAQPIRPKNTWMRITQPLGIKYRS